MDWRDEAIVLAARPHGESSAVVQLLTRAHGRHAGLVRGGASRRGRHTVEPGTMVVATWRARLADHLGHLTLDPSRQVAAVLLDDPKRLAALAAAAAVAESALPEREPHQGAYDGMAAFLGALEADEAGAVWPAVYVRWELGLLGELGFGLDLNRCAATGTRDDLVYVSPRTGRAVSRAAGAPYGDKLLPLPSFLVGGGAVDAAAIAHGLALTGHFLARHVFAVLDRPLPAARTRLVERLVGPGVPPEGRS
ncbi:MAG: DNA repair protein RecO [Alphaproteobacteria bacterium]